MGGLQIVVDRQLPHRAPMLGFFFDNDDTDFVCKIGEAP